MAIINYRPGIGKLASDRYDFANHTDGYGFRHNANQIDLSPIVTIDGVIKTNAQSSIEALNTLIEGMSSIPDATTTSKGIIQIAGDIEGTATNIIVNAIQGYPILTTVPSTEDVLTWNGFSWEPSAANNFIADGDLAGTYNNQFVYSLTGNSGSLNIYASDLTFSSAVTPIISQTATSSAGNDITIQAQNSTGVSEYAGSVVISGGSNNVDGFSGGVSLKMRAGASTLIDIKELGESILDPRRRVISLCGAVDTTDMPSLTGDSVIYISDAVTPPTDGNPVNGNILYSYDNHLWIKEEGGQKFQLSCYNNVIVIDGYCDGYDITQPNALFSTDSTSYTNVSETTVYITNVPIEIGDIIKVSFVGVVKCSVPLFIRATVIDTEAGVGDEFELDTEITGASNCLDNASSKTQINLSGRFIVQEDHNILTFHLQLKSSSGAYVYLYRPLSYIIEVLRPPSVL